MAITLAEAKVGMADKVDQQIVDMFRRSSLLLDNMVFDNVISPGTGGSTLTYGYIQLKSPATASVRTVGNEYTPGEAKKEEKTANAIIMGGAFQMDRVIQNTAGAANEMAFQAEQKIKATANYFHNLVINGTGAAEGEGYVTGTFDGLKKLLTGTANEITSQVSLTTSTELDNNYNAFLDEMDSFISTLDGTPSMLLMNRAMLVKLRSIARRAGYYERSHDDFGRTVETYAGIPMVDMGQYYNGTSVQDVVATDEAGKTAIYAVSLGLDGFHGISPMGDGVIQSYLPDLSTPGAVKTGEVELVAGVVLKNTLKAAVLKDIAIATAN
ncbi:MAG: phage capsid protein [Oscillospiraceae bacterium]|nr:phage capsid protein [Oscillospiraceae bacterium]